MTGKYKRGGFVPGTPQKIEVVPPRRHAPDDVPDLIINREGEIVAAVVWHADGTLSFGEDIK